MNNTTKKDEQNLLHSLVKLSDMMGNCDYGSKEYNYYAKQYRKIAKALYGNVQQNATPRKTTLRTPSKRFISALIPCDCGCKVFIYKSDGQTACITCKNCTRTSGIQSTNKLCRAAWNLTFNKH